MGLVLLVFTTLAAAGVGLFLLHRIDRSRLDQAGTAFLFLFVLVGALSVLPGFLLYSWADALFPPGPPGRWGQILFVWTVNAPVEELAKYLCFAVGTLVFSSLREPQDGLVQGAATGLGFGLVENVLYGLSGGLQLLLLRTLASLPGHVIYGAVWGGYHGFEVYQGRGRLVRPWVPLLALVPAAFSHALFNTLNLVGAPLVFSLFADGVTLAFGAFLFIRLRAHSPSQLRRPLKEWRLAIPELEHALALNPRSVSLRRRLAAYYLASGSAEKALRVLEPLAPAPWTDFYRDAATWRLERRSGPPPASSSLNPKLFQTLSGD